MRFLQVETHTYTGYAWYSYFPLFEVWLNLEVRWTLSPEPLRSVPRSAVDWGQFWHVMNTRVFSKWFCFSRQERYAFFSSISLSLSRSHFCPNASCRVNHLAHNLDGSRPRPWHALLRAWPGDGRCPAGWRPSRQTRGGGREMQSGTNLLQPTARETELKTRAETVSFNCFLHPPSA